ncbi:hypothetical protein TNCV_2634031 [Trichonephila clavipes]|nr:hypothetical protein TNCV_2634031 [Trichonephila clavipes]
MNDNSCYQTITSSLQHQQYDYYQTRAFATSSSTNLTDFTVRPRTAPCQPRSTVSELVSELILTSHCSATRGLLATDHVILNHGQVTWMTPELAPLSPNYHTTPTGGRFSSRQI